MPSNDAPRSFPFSARVSLPDTVGDVTVDVLLKERDSGELEQTNQVFAHFMAAAQGGMFAGEGVSPTESRFREVMRERAAPGLRYRCELRGVDPGAFRILLNLLAGSSCHLEPLDEVQLTGISPPRNDLGLGEVLARPFPGRVREVPFELKLRPFFFDGPEPLIRMEFQRELADEEFDRIKFMVDAWDTLLMLGGYRESPTREAGRLFERGELFEFILAEPTVLEHLVYAFEGPEEAFNSVINMAVNINSRVCPLVSLEFE